MINADVLARDTSRCIHFTTPNDDEYLFDDLLRFDLVMIDLQGDVITSADTLYGDVRESRNAPPEVNSWERFYSYLIDNENVDASGYVAIVWDARQFWEWALHVAGASFLKS